MKHELYGWIHKTAKLILKKKNGLIKTVKLVNFPEFMFEDGRCFVDASFINDIKYPTNHSISKSDVYPVENLVPSTFMAPASFTGKGITFTTTTTLSEAIPSWQRFIEAATIPEGYRNAGCLYAGFIKEAGDWCLPSWIWTNAAIVRWYCLSGEIDKAKTLGDRLIARQQPCGGWIVRNDYGKDCVSPQLAPNDSCYLALYSCLELYEAIKEKKYLESAEKNAKWVIETARDDGLVWFAYDTMYAKWIKEWNIVDTGFTAGLFARLYEITGKAEYRNFLVSFIKKYIEAFYMPSEKCFSTAIDRNDNQFGGAFGRGQGWALEGLIPTYRVLKDISIKIVIHNTVETLLRLQTIDGGWSYNLKKPLMGEDCKAVPIIARCLLEWYEEENDERYISAAKKALEWCVSHTAASGIAEGGIFSYTIEGAIVHHMYTSTAFIYGSSYALEVAYKLKGK